MAFWFIVTIWIKCFLALNFPTSSFFDCCQLHWWCWRFSCSRRDRPMACRWVFFRKFCIKVDTSSVMPCFLCHIGELLASRISDNGSPGRWQFCMQWPTNFTSHLYRADTLQRSMYWSTTILAPWHPYGSWINLQNKNNQTRNAWLPGKPCEGFW